MLKVDENGEKKEEKKKKLKVDENGYKILSFYKSPYCLRNPYVKLSSGYYDIQEEVLAAKEIRNSVLITGEGMLD